MDLDYAKIGFLFLVFAIISGGYVTQVLSCQIQRFLSNSLLGKHIIGFLLAFVFIMMEGGWSFDQETQKKAPVDWSNGNVLDSMVFAVGLYSTKLSSRQPLTTGTQRPSSVLAKES